ncbi:acetylornithine transaminase [Specibacter sp. NPDC057265]|uniref:acetylornithine transaminase n=1 Tax=Specibacter sp. NPDC057265 TaxID=3346075 RepID=UPI00362E6CB1
MAELSRQEPKKDVAAFTGTGTGAQWLERYNHSLMGVFGTPQRVLVRGAGAVVWDADGREYLDLLGGIAVNALGHAHPFVNSVIAGQLATLGHVSNFFTTPTQIALAEKLLALAHAPEGSKVFFANSGTEANEAAFKLARAHGGTARPTILALEGGFHGRTMGALAMTHKAAYREPFEPMPAGVRHVAFNDVDALRAAMDGTVAALVLEPIQGEAGVRPLSAAYLQAARELTREHGALLVFDEVQTGVGRTGEWFAGLAAGVVPDAMTLAKGLGGGFPIGAMVTFGQAASTLLSAGQHGTTFGGNPVAAAAALATLHVLESQGVLDNVRKLSQILAEGLAGTGGVTDVRAHGLLIGFDLAVPVAAEVVAAALGAGFIINAPKANTVRLAPPLNLSAAQGRSFLAALPALIAAAATPFKEKASS